MATATSLLAHTLPRLDGKPQPLSDYADKVLLVVNTASYCGFTSQYAGLQRLYQQYRPRGLEILGFPSNEFGAQEPAEALQIASFCHDNFGVTFPMFGKTTVTQERANPFHAALAEVTGQWPQWNFHKYVVSRSGAVKSYSSSVEPEAPELVAEIERMLGEGHA